MNYALKIMHYELCIELSIVHYELCIELNIMHCIKRCFYD